MFLFSMLITYLTRYFISGTDVSQRRVDNRCKLYAFITSVIKLIQLY